MLEIYLRNRRKILILIFIIITNYTGFLVKDHYYLNIINKNSKVKYQTTMTSLLSSSKKVKNRKIVKKKEIREMQRHTPNAVNKAFNIHYVFFLISMLSLIKIKPMISHGSARFANITDLIQRKKTDTKDINLLNKKGVVLGRYGKHTLRDDSNTHNLVIAPTRAGKGVGIIIPTLLDGWDDGSTIILDLKGENYIYTADYRRVKMKNKVFLIDYRENGCKYNPFSEIPLGTEFEITEAMTIADIIINTGESEYNKTTFWNTTSVDILTGIIIYCLYLNKENANLYEVVKFIKEGDLRETVQICKRDILSEKQIFNLMSYYPNEDVLLKNEHPYINRIFSQIVSFEDKVYSNIKSTLNTKLSLYEVPAIIEQTRSSDFKLEDLANYKVPCSLYIKVNAKDLSLFSPLVNILLSQLINKLLNERVKENKIFENKQKILFLLDEFPALGEVKQIKESITFVAGYGLKYMLIIQSLDQLYKIYTDNNPFMSNCQVKVFYTPNDLKTAKYISEICGVKTIKVRNSSGKGGQSSSLQARKLMTDDEVMRYSSEKGFIQAGNKPIVLSTNIKYYEDKEYKDKACQSKIRQDAL